MEDRDALYYPYIHLRDEAWVRTALLFFPHVLRMVPPRYPLNDSPFVRQLANTLGRRDEPLVGAYPLNSGAAQSAGERLAARLARDVEDEGFRRRHDRAATLAGFGDDGVFQIHVEKVVERLANVLHGTGLMWEPARPERGSWIAVHPQVGEAIMSTMAVAVARDAGCDILTDTGRAHVATVTEDEDVLYAMLLGAEKGRPEPRKPQVQEIGGLVLAATVDASGLTAEDYAALSRETGALFDFRRRLAERAARIPPLGDEQRRHAAAREAALEIVEEWENSRRTWGKFLRRLWNVDAADEAKDAATELLKAAGVASLGAGAAAAAAGLGSTLLVAVPGLAVGLALYGVKTWSNLGVEERTSPTRFLSTVSRRGATLASA